MVDLQVHLPSLASCVSKLQIPWEQKTAVEQKESLTLVESEGVSFSMVFLMLFDAVCLKWQLCESNSEQLATPCFTASYQGISARSGLVKSPPWETSNANEKEDVQDDQHPSLSERESRSDRKTWCSCCHGRERFFFFLKSRIEWVEVHQAAPVHRRIAAEWRRPQTQFGVWSLGGNESIQWLQQSSRLKVGKATHRTLCSLHVFRRRIPLLCHMMSVKTSNVKVYPPNSAWTLWLTSTEVPLARKVWLKYSLHGGATVAWCHLSQPMSPTLNAFSGPNFCLLHLVFHILNLRWKVKQTEPPHFSLSFSIVIWLNSDGPKKGLLVCRSIHVLQPLLHVFLDHWKFENTWKYKISNPEKIIILGKGGVSHFESVSSQKNDLSLVQGI